MKVTMEVDCTPDEARRFMGLPDVERVNDIYIDSVTRAMQGVTSVEQLETYVRQFAPMGQFGLKMFQTFLCLLYTSPSPRDKRQSRMPSSA